MKKDLDEEIVSNFKKELKALMKKYDMDIWVTLDGDTHGVSYELKIDLNDQTVISSHEGLSYHDID